MRHWRGRVAGFLAGLLLGGWLIATPAAQSYVWGAINGIPFGPGLVLSGPILAPDGSAAAPSLAFASDPDTGIYSTAGGGNVSIAVNGSKQYTFYPNSFQYSPGSATGSSSVSAFTITQTWNTTGAPVFADWTITDTASDAASLAFRIRGGAAGTTNLLSLSKTGNVFIGGAFIAASGGYLEFQNRTYINATGVGVLNAVNATSTGFTTLNLGPVTGNTASGSTSITHINATIDMATASGTGTGTITVPGFFTAGCKLEGFSARVTTILAGAALTTWSAGTGGATTVFGTGLAIAANTVANSTTYTANPSTTFYGGAAKDLVITAAAGVFSTGVLKATATCITTTAIGS